MKLVLRNRDEVRASIEALPAELRAQVSAEWLAQLAQSAWQDPWAHGFHVLDAEGTVVGQAGFKGPPSDGVVEIAYAIEPDHQGKGHATAAALQLVAFAFESGKVCVVRAHTLIEGAASQRVLTKCGFRTVGEVIDPEDGPVLRFEIARVAERS